MSRPFQLFANRPPGDERVSRIMTNILAAQQHQQALMDSPREAMDVPRAPSSRSQQRPQSANATKRKTQHSRSKSHIERAETPINGQRVAHERPRSAHQNHMRDRQPQQPVVATEDLANELFELKKKYLEKEETISFLKGENHRLETEVNRQQRRIDQLMALSEGVKGTVAAQQGLRKEIEKSILVRQLKSQMSALKSLLADRDAEIDSLRKDVRGSHTRELEMEREEFIAEISRLSKAVEHLTEERDRERSRREWSNRLAGESGDEMKKELARLAANYQQLLQSLSSVHRTGGGMAVPHGAAGISDRPPRPSSAATTRSHDRSHLSASNSQQLQQQQQQQSTPKRLSLRDALLSENGQPTAGQGSMDLLENFKPDAFSVPVDDSGAEPRVAFDSALVQDRDNNRETTSGKEPSSTKTQRPLDLTISSQESQEDPPNNTHQNNKSGDLPDDNSDLSDDEQQNYADEWSGHKEDGNDETKKTSSGVRPNTNVVTVSTPSKAFAGYPPINGSPLFQPPQQQHQQLSLSNTSQSSSHSSLYPGALFRINEKVQALYSDGQWYDALIRGLHRQSEEGRIPIVYVYEVGYMDGGYDKACPADRIRKPGAKPIANTMPPNASSTAQSSPSATTSAVESASQSEKQSPSLFEIGDKIESRYYQSESWYKGSIKGKAYSSAKSSYVYDILYDDGETEKAVIESNIRSPAPLSPKKAIDSKIPSESQTSSVKEVDNGVKTHMSHATSNESIKEDFAELQLIANELKSHEQHLQQQQQQQQQFHEVAPTSKASPRIDSGTKEVLPFPINSKALVYFPPYKSWYIGRVQVCDVSRSICALQFDDGDFDDSVPFARMLACNLTPTTVLEPDATVLAKYQNGDAWFAATIISCTGNGAKVRYTLRFADGDVEPDVPSERLQKVDEDWLKAILPTASLPSNATRNDNQQPSERPKPEFSVNDLVEGHFQSAAWYPGRIASADYKKCASSSSEQWQWEYAVEYDDGDRESGLTSERLRRRVSSPPAMKPSLDISKAPFRIGEKVEGFFQSSAWFPAVIADIRPPANSLTTTSEWIFDLKYDDGDEEKSLPVERVRLSKPVELKVATKDIPASKPSPPRFAVNDIVDGFYDRQAWYPAKVAAVREVTDSQGILKWEFDLLYDDGDKEAGLSEDRVRERSVAQPVIAEAIVNDSKPVVQAPLTHVTDVGIKKNENETAKPVLSYSVGEKVEGFFDNDAWYPATITAIREVIVQRIRNWEFDLLYDDGDRESGLSENRLRKISVGVSNPVSAAVAATAVNPTLKETTQAQQPAESATVEYQWDEKEEKFLFSVGEAVQGNYQDEGKWYDATVLLVSFPSSSAAALKTDSLSTKWDKARYLLRYNDGDEESDIPSHRVRKPLLQLDCYSIGDKIEGNYDNQGIWFPGRVLRESITTAATSFAIQQEMEKVYDVLYEDGEEERDVPVRRLRLLKRRLFSTAASKATAASSSSATSNPAPQISPREDHALARRTTISTNLDSFLNDLSDDDDAGEGLGGLDGGKPVTLTANKQTNKVYQEEVDVNNDDEYGDDFAA